MTSETIFLSLPHPSTCSPSFLINLVTGLSILLKNELFTFLIPFIVYLCSTFWLLFLGFICFIKKFLGGCFSSVQFSHSVMSDSLPPHGLQDARPPCPSPTLEVYSHSCPLTRSCHPTISSSVIPFSSCPQSFPASGSFQMSIRWPKYWSFSFKISPSNEYSGLISFRMDWLYLLAVQGTLKSHLQYHSLKASILWSSAVFIVQLSHPYSLIPYQIAFRSTKNLSISHYSPHPSPYRAQ